MPPGRASTGLPSTKTATVRTPSAPCPTDTDSVRPPASASAASARLERSTCASPVSILRPTPVSPASRSTAVRGSSTVTWSARPETSGRIITHPAPPFWAASRAARISFSVTAALASPVLSATAWGSRTALVSAAPAEELPPQDSEPYSSW